MRLPIVIRNIGLTLILNAIMMFISFLISVFNNESSALPLLYSTFIALLFGIFPLVFVPESNYISSREGLLIVVFGWIINCLIGSLPYILWGGEFSFINAWFESVSGYTTTGSSILSDVEALPYGLLFWRSATHWIGGIGIILFSLLILPDSRNARMVLLNIEISEIAKSNFRYRSHEVLRILAFVYLGLTLLETILLSVFGMSVFDAINHSFATIATGGFSTKNLSVSHFNSVAIEVIIMVFMLLSGLHFGLIYATIMRQKYNLFTSTIVRWFIAIIFFGIVAITAKLYLTDYGTVWKSLRYASFQVISLATTTGFATTDTAHWNPFAIIILIYFTLQCACVGSTSGGLKFDRVYIFARSVAKQLRLIKHPDAIIVVKTDGKSISEQTENNTLTFIVLYMVIILISSIIVTAQNVDILTAFSGAVTTIGNVGPGFAQVSSLGNFGGLPALSKFIYTIDMLLGRLEIFGLISLFFIRSKH